MTSESRLGLTPGGPDTDDRAEPTSDRPVAQDATAIGHGPDRFDLIITAVEPQTLDYLRPTDWADLLTPNGTLAVITHGERSAGRFTDPASSLVRRAHGAGLRYLDRVALLTAPVRDGALATVRPAASHRSQPSPKQSRTTVRHVPAYDDLLLFTRQAIATGTTRGGRPPMTERPVSPWPLPLPTGEGPSIPPLSVWPTGQRDLVAQLRDSGCVPGTGTDAEQIPPAVAAHAIATYTRPGELVLDPDCGTGTVLVEALRASRHAIGLTARPRWWKIARANITAAKSAGAWRDGMVLDAHPRVLATVRAVGLIGRVGLVLTALRTTTGDDPANPDRDLDVSFRALAQTLDYCEPLLRAGGHLAVVTRPRRHPDGSLVDLTTPLIAAGAATGLVPVERCIALSAELRGIRLITRASFAERRAARARAGGPPVALVAHREVIVFQLVHDAELAAAAAVGVSRPTTPAPGRVAVSGARYPGWGRAA